MLPLLAFSALSRAAPEPALWRSAGHLVARDGRSIDYVVDFFRYRTSAGVEVFPAQATIIDEKTLRRYNRRFIERAPAAGERDDANADSVRDGDWALGVPLHPGAPVTLRIRIPGAALDLTATPEKSPVTLDLGFGASTFWTSLACTATATLANESVHLSGKGWLERTAPAEALAPESGVRESFVAQLDDGREVVVESHGATAHDARPRAALIGTHGAVEMLSEKQYFFGGRNRWHSTHTPTDYPDQWGIYVPGQTQILLFEPLMIDQESDGHGAGADFYEASYDIFDYTPGSNGARLGSASGLLLGFGNPGAMP